MKKILMILLLTIATILPTYATNWVQVGQKVYMDIDTIEPFIDDYGHVVPNQYLFWRKTLNDGNFKALEKTLNKKIWYSLSKCVVDINRKSWATKFFVIYDLKDKPITQEEYNSALMDWQSIIPNTVGDLELYTVKKFINGKSLEEQENSR